MGLGWTGFWPGNARRMGSVEPERADAENLSPSERREWIVEQVFREGTVSAKRLASLFGVSVMTIYRDLDELEERRILRRERGGASAQPTSLFESDVRYRILKYRQEKEALCARAVQEIEPGQVVMVDDSTSALPLASMLPSLAPLTVITNFRLMLEELSGRTAGVQLICLGGEYLPSHDAYVGVVCETAISSVRPDILFMSTSAVSGGDAFHQEPEMVRIKRAMLAVARRKVLLLDHSKLGKRAVHYLAPLGEFDLVLTDDGASPETLSELDERGITHEVISMPRLPD